VIAEGEVAQLTTANDTSTDEDGYLIVIRAKTAALFAAACRIGAVIGGRPDSEESALDQYGLNLGIAFQLVDDYLDYGAADIRLGKAVGDDFREGKITLPIILAFRRGDSTQQNFWRRTLEDLDQRDGDLDHARRLLIEYDALSDTQVRARGYAETARAALDIFPRGALRTALEEVVDFCVERSY
jgi:octaprenyl-diphosphate synthase